jgi:hypothetical protein
MLASSNPRFDGGDRSAGSIQLVKRAVSEEEPAQYRVFINSNHSAPVKNPGQLRMCTLICFDPWVLAILWMFSRSSMFRVTKTKAS